MSKRAWFVITVLITAVLWYFWFRSPTSVEESAQSASVDEVAHQIWISEFPENPKDKVDVFLMIEEPNFGQFLTTSAYEGDYAVFEWKESRDGIGLVFPQSGKKHKLSFKVDEDSCYPFDLCLTVKGAPRGSKRYVSMEDWVIDGALEQSLDTVRAHLKSIAAPQK